MTRPPLWFLILEATKREADASGTWDTTLTELAEILGGPVPVHRTTVWRAIGQAIDFGLLDPHSTTRTVRLP